MKNSFTKNSAALVALSLTLAFGSSAFAVRVAGNGGDAFKPDTGGARFLDLVREPSKAFIDVVDEGYLARVNDVLDRNRGYALATFFPSSEGKTRHEAFIRMYTEDIYNPDLDSTEKIASLVHATFRSTSKNGLSPAAVSRYLCDIGIGSDPIGQFGMSSVNGILSLKSTLPRNLVAFSNTGGICQTVSLTITGGLSGEISSRRHPTAATAISFKFEGTGPTGENGIAFFSVIEWANYQTEAHFKSRIPGIVTESRFGFWAR